MSKLSKNLEYFVSPWCQQNLENIQKKIALPTGVPIIDGKMRVASVCKLFETSLFHYHAMMKYYHQLQIEDVCDKFLSIWFKIGADDWQNVS